MMGILEDLSGLLVLRLPKGAKSGLYAGTMKFSGFTDLRTAQMCISSCDLRLPKCAHH